MSQYFTNSIYSNIRKKRFVTLYKGNLVHKATLRTNRVNSCYKIHPWELNQFGGQRLIASSLHYFRVTLTIVSLNLALTMVCP